MTTIFYVITIFSSHHYTYYLCFILPIFIFHFLPSRSCDNHYSPSFLVLSVFSLLIIVVECKFIFFGYPGFCSTNYLWASVCYMYSLQIQASLIIVHPHWGMSSSYPLPFLPLVLICSVPSLPPVPYVPFPHLSFITRPPKVYSIL